MPAHISHSLFAEELLYRLDIVQAHALMENPLSRAALHVGAQGPDIFYHGRRSTPSAVLIGSVVHRKGFGSLCTRMLEYCLVNEKSQESPEGLYLLAFISHGILDRFLHPYINYFSGWVDHEDPSTRIYRHNHAFMERILDVGIYFHALSEGHVTNISWHGSEKAGAHFAFSRLFDMGETLHRGIHAMIISALRQVYRRMGKDEELPQRIDNAYRDSRGFYRYCELPREGSLPEGWTSLLHPSYLPVDGDFLNLGHQDWKDPCHGSVTSSASIHQLWEMARDFAESVIEPVWNILKGSPPPPGYAGLAAVLGDEGLRTNEDEPGSDMPCRLTHCDPLNLHELISRLSEDPQPRGWVPAEKALNQAAIRTSDTPDR